ncbi:molybdenum cofactor biosynthesis protein MoaE [Methylocaldum sp.]|uniref:molybdenum cofactor biosynthesis protein MoaE n=1 Tax=Methylocaldum sp. TaxID=1969727 RepID=UPI002D45FF01|nr:molybdenum cofactor biosynthesis protein MoaE [Methylocaldum sp.]HYE35999.1 molybdenum cofactor biosynthesis protein MoaE [Methylocaldum sp.]
MLIALRPTGFDPYAELLRYQTEILGHAGKYGATCSFVGTMRDFNESETVRHMFLDHYPGMTEKQLEKIVEEAQSRWSFLDALVIHRVGEILPDQPIVLVAVWSSHRGAAFDACRYIMEELKSRAPFWKKEALEQSERWVEKNTSGY